MLVNFIFLYNRLRKNQTMASVGAKIFSLKKWLNLKILRVNGVQERCQDKRGLCYFIFYIFYIFSGEKGICVVPTSHDKVRIFGVSVRHVSRSHLLNQLAPIPLFKKCGYHNIYSSRWTWIILGAYGEFFFFGGY